MRGWSRTAVFASVCLVVFIGFAHGQGTAPNAKPGVKPTGIMLLGYQQINGKFLFSLRVSNLMPTDQPPLMATGDKFRFGPYQVGAFHPAVHDTIDLVTGHTVKADDSTLEIIDLVTGAKTQLHFRRQTELN
jgi:hypothetical protein